MQRTILTEVTVRNDRLPAGTKRVAIALHLAAQVVVPFERHHTALEFHPAPGSTLIYHH